MLGCGPLRLGGDGRSGQAVGRRADGGRNIGGEVAEPITVGMFAMGTLFCVAAAVIIPLVARRLRMAGHTA